MGYLLDTNIVSEVRKGARANRGVSAWLAEAADEELYLSVLTAGELRRGIDSISGATRRLPPRSTDGFMGLSSRLGIACCRLTTPSRPNGAA